MISTVKIGISNIIESQTLSSSYSGSFSGSLFTFFEIHIFLNLLVSLVFHVHCWIVTPAYEMYEQLSFIYIYYSRYEPFWQPPFSFQGCSLSLSSGLFTHISVTL